METLDDAILADICADVAAGEPVHASIKAHGISARRFYATLDGSEKAAECYARAKSIGMDRMADDTLRVADDPNLDPNDKRVRVDTRKWLLSKLAPKKYGDRTILSNDPDNPIPPLVVIGPHGKSEG